jgi:hypothetical protein
MAFRLQDVSNLLYDFKWLLTKWKRLSSGMLRRVALITTDVSEERIASMIMVTRIGELGKRLSVTSNRSRLRRITIISSQRISVDSYC